ncbi:MAG: hypothetical protein HZB53_06510 [Chloroflexi bacterium]|nr:hypothetical protein [Chloroflexota bacterium]
MTNFDETLLREVAALPKSRRADVLAFVRYLRLSLMDDAELDRRYDAAVEQIRETGKQYAISDLDVEAEIRAVRESHVRH